MEWNVGQLFAKSVDICCGRAVIQLGLILSEFLIL